MALPTKSFSLTERGKLFLVLGIALFQGLLYMFLLPPWQHYDEPTHFEYAWLIANRSGLPERGDEDQLMRREMAASMVAHHFYWNLTNPDLLTDSARINIGISELTHPPVYYLLVSLPLRLARHLDLTTQLYLARLLSLLLFMLTILVGVGFARSLTGPDHPLRWLLPLSLALFPPFVNQMTSVNNDVGAVLIFSFFLWGGVQTIRFGPSWWRILWVIGAALLAVFTKTTAGIALLLMPLVLVLALWVRQGWRWRWLALVTVVGVGAGLLAVLDWGDAAYWYREGYKQSQASTTQVARSEVPLGTHALRLEITEEDPARGLLNPLSPTESAQVAGKTVTIGGWVWADRTARVTGPALIASTWSSRELIHLREPITVTQAPTLVMHMFEVPTDTGKLYYSLFAHPREVGEEPLYLYLDGAFLVEGALPEGAQPTIEGDQLVVGGESRPNLLRNPSAEQAWVRVRPWLDGLITRYSRRSPSFTLAALIDFERSGKFLTAVVWPWLLSDYFTAFAWGHVRVQGTFWVTLASSLVWLALVGTVWWAITRGKERPNVLPALLFLGFVLVLVWVNALIWPLPYPMIRPPMPSSRYVLPAVLPATLFLAGGWRALWPARLRPLGVLLFVLAFVALNILSINTIQDFYEGVANAPRLP